MEQKVNKASRVLRAARPIVGFIVVCMSFYELAHNNPSATFDLILGIWVIGPVKR